MKNLSVETIEKTLQENFANEFATMVSLNSEYYANEPFGGGKAIETLIELKEDVSCKMITMLLDENDNEYWEQVELIEMTIGNLVEDATEF